METLQRNVRSVHCPVYSYFLGEPLNWVANASSPPKVLFSEIDLHPIHVPPYDLISTANSDCASTFRLQDKYISDGLFI